MQHGWCGGSGVSPGCPWAARAPGDNPPRTGTCTKPSAAGGGMQQIKLEKLKYSHCTPITLCLCDPIPGDEDDVQAQDKTIPSQLLPSSPKARDKTFL